MAFFPPSVVTRSGGSSFQCKNQWMPGGLITSCPLKNLTMFFPHLKSYDFRFHGVSSLSFTSTSPQTGMNWTHPLPLDLHSFHICVFFLLLKSSTGINSHLGGPQQRRVSGFRWASPSQVSPKISDKKLRSEKSRGFFFQRSSRFWVFKWSRLSFKVLHLMRTKALRAQLLRYNQINRGNFGNLSRLPPSLTSIFQTSIQISSITNLPFPTVFSARGSSTVCGGLTLPIKIHILKFQSLPASGRFAKLRACVWQQKSLKEKYQKLWAILQTTKKVQCQC